MLACEANGPYVESAMCIFYMFMKKTESFALATRIRLSFPKSKKKEEDVLTLYCEVVNYLLKIYVTIGDIEVTDADIAVSAAHFCVASQI